MAETTTFERNVASSDLQYLWSNPANWSNGVPVDGDDVVVSTPVNTSENSSIDDIASLHLLSLDLDSGSNVYVEDGLTVDNVALQTASSGSNITPSLTAGSNVVVDGVSGSVTGSFNADGGAHLTIAAAAAEDFEAIDGGIVELTQQPVAGDVFGVGSAGGTLQFDTVAPGTVLGSLTFLDFDGTNDTIELPGTSVLSVTNTTTPIGYDGVEHDLKITTNTTSLEFTNVVWDFDDEAAPAGYTAHFDASTGLMAITFCFCPGTLIATERGEVAVEDLVIGDHVLTVDGGVEPVKWIGQRSYDGRFIAGNTQILPITIRAGALADGVPRADLTVSPGHAIGLDGQLVPAGRLVNGVSITQAAAVETVSYFHVELLRHALLLANGTPAESFLNRDGFRRQFQNVAAFDAPYPDAPDMTPLQARLEDGFALQFLQAKLAGRAGVPIVAEPAGAVRGYIDHVARDRVGGWAQDLDSPEEPVILEISVGGRPFLCVPANAWRADLQRAGVGSGCHAFDVALPAGLPGAVTVCRATDRSMLPVADTVVHPAQRLAA